MPTTQLPPTQAADERQQTDTQGACAGLTAYSETPGLELERHDGCRLVVGTRPEPQYVNHAEVTLEVRGPEPTGRMVAHVELTQVQARALALRLWGTAR